MMACNGRTIDDSPPFTPPTSPVKTKEFSFHPPSSVPLIQAVPGLQSPFLIGVAGGTASGKTSVCHKIMEKLGQTDSSSRKRVVMISQDSFYKKLEPCDKQLADRGEYNFDHPGVLGGVVSYIPKSHSVVSY